MTNVMTKINFHVHSTGSDGKSTPEEVVLEAIEKGFKFICFTDHTPFPDEFVQTNGPFHPIYLKELNFRRTLRNNFHSKEYVSEIRSLQKKYSDQIDISFGIEFDWFKYDLDWTRKVLKKENYDYILGSVHTVSLDGMYWPLELGWDGKEHLTEIVSSWFGSFKNLVIGYYKDMREMAESKLFDGIAHFDIIKMYNFKHDLFDEHSSWYKKEVLSTLDVISENGLVIEINTRGKLKITGDFYPSFWILEEAKKRNIPITIGTDAHIASGLDYEYQAAVDYALKAGYTEIYRFKGRKKYSVSLK